MLSKRVVQRQVVFEKFRPHFFGRWASKPIWKSPPATAALCADVGQTTDGHGPEAGGGRFARPLGLFVPECWRAGLRRRQHRQHDDRRAFNTAQNCVGLVVCDWSGCAIGCSAVAPALRYLPTTYFLGLAWNCRQRRTPDQLTDITAHAFLGSTELAPLFHAALAVGKVERALSPLSSRAAPVSAIVQILLNADSLDLDNKARIELQASLDGLENLKRHCDFNNDQTLALLEMEVVLDLTILACRIGQSLCMLGTNPSPAYGCQMINVGISNLSPTARTDLANSVECDEHYPTCLAWSQFGHHFARGDENVQQSASQPAAIIDA
ncbi:conserved hypothetical protein [Trichinella spiralis]|uniref:hypothetical protein n=1 Tax=Trichinella spiralis TaxID=6334 RepID=UPI0001EFE235|nr:conserved hypothetical protein [Trichinella spiralis]